MAIYRAISMNFWTDSKVVDDFTPEDRYFYLYLCTNPHTRLCGCYEISLNQISNETGYNRESIRKLVDRFEKEHNIIRYSYDTKEMLLLNWHKYNWTKSEKCQKALEKEFSKIKNIEYQEYLTNVFHGMDTVSIPYAYPMDTTVSVTVTDTVSISDTVTDAKSNQYSQSFEEAWKSYPRKKEKAKAYKCYKARLKEGYTEEQLALAVDRYATECQRLGTEERFIKHGATFFGSSLPFADYLSEDYRPPDVKKKANQFHNFDQRECDSDIYAKIEQAKRGW